MSRSTVRKSKQQKKTKTKKATTQAHPASSLIKTAKRLMIFRAI